MCGTYVHTSAGLSQGSALKDLITKSTEKIEIQKWIKNQSKQESDRQIKYQNNKFSYFYFTLSSLNNNTVIGSMMTDHWHQARPISQIISNVCTSVHLWELCFSSRLSLGVWLRNKPPQEESRKRKRVE